MLAAGTQVQGGVTPGKGGQTALDLPIFDTVEEAVKETGANVSCIFVPPMGAADAIMEAAAAGIPLIVCITELIPVADMTRVAAFLKEHPARLIGPNCPGLATPGAVKFVIFPTHFLRGGDVVFFSLPATLTYGVVPLLTQAAMG